jgi:hypothetical protein
MVPTGYNVLRTANQTAMAIEQAVGYHTGDDLFGGPMPGRQGETG